MEREGNCRGQKVIIYSSKVHIALRVVDVF